MEQVCRHDAIYAILRKKGRASCLELQQDLGVSLMTVRRDLDKLASKGLVQKFHGGAELSRPNLLQELPFSKRKQQEVEKKMAIAVEAVKLVNDGDRIYIDGSTTGEEFAKRLRGRQNLIVVTDSLSIQLELYQVSGITVISLGGTLQSDGNTMEGPLAVDNAHRLKCDKAFFSCAGFDESGITNPGPIGTEIKRIVSTRADRSVLLADSTKWGKRGFMQFMDLSEIDLLVTDDGIPAEAVDVLKRLNVETVTAMTVKGRGI